MILEKYDIIEYACSKSLSETSVDEVFEFSKNVHDIHEYFF